MAPGKILILYATAGAGHKKAAEAIFCEAKARSLDVELVDITEHMSPLEQSLYSDGYALLITKMIWLWTFLYHVSDHPRLGIVNVHLRRFMNAILCRKLNAFLIEKNPDVVISTHFLASEAVSYLKQKAGLRVKLCTVITDFEVHNFWIAPETDVYCCATEATKKILLDKSIDEQLIKITGIPVDPKFLKPQNKDQLLEEFSIKKNRMTVLLVTGGLGAGPMEEIVELLKNDTELLVVCGNNKELLKKLSLKKYENVRLFGFVDYMQKLMKVSDVIITKAGGLTITESLTMSLPMIFFYLIPGQEVNNAKTMARCGAGVITKSLDEIKKQVLIFKNNPDIYACYKNAAASLARPNSSGEIIDACLT